MFTAAPAQDQIANGANQGGDTQTNSGDFIGRDVFVAPQPSDTQKRQDTPKYVGQQGLSPPYASLSEQFKSQSHCGCGFYKRTLTSYLQYVTGHLQARFLCRTGVFLHAMYSHFPLMANRCRARWQYISLVP